MPLKLFKQLIVVGVMLSMVLTQGTWALAGTTGTLNGIVADSGSGAPVANTHVTVTSASQTASTITDSSGHFAFVSLTPDTYTVSALKDGYDPASLAGVTVTSDQANSIRVTIQKSLKTIAKVTSKAAGALVKAGTTADVYSVSAAVQKAAGSLGGGGGLNNAYSAIASVPGVFVPAGQKGEYQSIFVRGGNYTQVGYEFDGVPVQRAFDQYPGASLSNLGQQELQVYTGSAPVNSDSTALAGFVNQVIKSGTYPGFGSIGMGFGAPGYYHQFKAEAGGANPNRTFSYYAGFLGYNQTWMWEKGTEFSSIYGSPINMLAQGCNTPNPSVGCYTNGQLLGPNGFEHGPIFFGSGSALASRDAVVNFHFAIPHKNDGGRDDLQLLYTNDYVYTGFASSLSDMGGYANDFLHGTITTANGVIPSCSTKGLAPNAPCSVYYGAGSGYIDRYYDKIVYGGNLGVLLTPNDLTDTQFSYFPNSPTNRNYSLSTAAGVPIPLTERDSYQQNGSIVKLQYQHNMGSNAFLRGYAYQTYSDWLQYAPNGQALGQSSFGFGSISPDYKLGSHTTGVALNFTDQISAQHLLNVNASYTTAHTFRFNNSGIVESTSAGSPSTNAVAFLVDSTNPTNGICYKVSGGVTAAVDCGSGSVARYVDPQSPSQLGAAGYGAQCTALGVLCTAHSADPTVANAGTLTCGGHPCAYLAAANGVNATYNTVVPQFGAVSLQDAFRMNDKWLFTLGLRYDDFKYVLPDTTGNAARTFWVNYYNTWYCYNPTTQGVSAASALGVTTPNGCSTKTGWQQVAFSAKSPHANDYPELQPRFGFTFTQDANNVYRFSAGKTAQPASSAYQQYNTVAPNIFSGTNQLFYGMGFTNPSHIVYPEESFNYDFSWEHNVKGTDVSWKVSPYLRTTKNELSTVLLDPKTNFVSAVNVGQKNVKGIELAISKGDLNRNGWFGQLAYTYTYAREKFTKLPNGKSVVDGLNISIAQYNAFTKFCSQNPADARCTVAGTAPTDPNTGKAIVAAPCYNSTTHAADPSCGAGSIANPYWNAPAQSLFDPNGQYAVYGTMAGSRFVTGSNQSYIVPHVASLILNYKHDKLNVTPSFQFMGGGEYGRPTQVVGMDPTGCGTGLGGAVASNDPRYQYGAAGGQPYNAENCATWLVMPDPYTKHFDNYAQFKEPNVFYGNLSLSYEVSPKVTARLDLVNVLAKCFGGSNVPWKISGNAGCNYGSGGVYVGNFYNPGDNIEQYVKYPYNPNFGSVFQSTSGGQANPFQAYFSLNVKL